MDDKELLEKAASAAGIIGEWEQRLTGTGISIANQSTRVWNPLTDDGDALRLAVKLCMQVEMSKGWQHASVYGHAFRIDEEITGDPCAATRRAIVRAAAEVSIIQLVQRETEISLSELNDLKF